MTINTKIFGEIGVDEERVITFVNGIVGFPDLKNFLLLYESDTDGGIKWLQSIEEPAFAMPVIDPLVVKEDYNPSVEDELLKPLEIKDENDILVLVTLTVPSEVEKMSVNLCAPIIISGETRKACQVIIEQGDYPIKFPIYEILKKKKEGAGE